MPKKTVNIRVFEDTYKRLKKRAVDKRITLMTLLDGLSHLKL